MRRRSHICETIVGGLLMTCCAGAQSRFCSLRSHAPRNRAVLVRQESRPTGQRADPRVSHEVPLGALLGRPPRPRGLHSAPANIRPRAAPVGTLAIRWESAALVREGASFGESKEYNEALASWPRTITSSQSSERRRTRTIPCKPSYRSHWSAQEDNESRDAIARQAPKKGLAGPPPPLIPVLIGNERAARAFHANRLLRPGYEETIPARVVSGENAEGLSTSSCF